MEPGVKRLKTDNNSTENGISKEKPSISNESSCDGKKSVVKQGSEMERALDAGNEQLPVCQHGAACNETDLIHFAEFWHPTEKQDGDDNNNDGDENYEENECEVIELPYYEAASTQPVFDEDYSDSGSENGEAETSDAQKSEERIYSTDSLGSQ